MAVDYKICAAETRETLWGVDHLAPAAPLETTSQDCAATTSRRLQEGAAWGRQETALPAGQTVVAMYDGAQHATGPNGATVRPAAQWAHTLACQYADQIRQVEYHVSDGIIRNGLTRIEFDNDATLWIVAFDTTDALREMDPTAANQLVPQWMELYLQMDLSSDDDSNKPWIVATTPNCWSDHDNISTCHTYRTMVHQFDRSHRILLADGSSSSLLRQAAGSTCVSPLDRMTWDVTQRLFA